MASFGSFFSPPIVKDDQLIPGYVYKITLNDNLYYRLAFFYPGAPKEYEGVYLKPVEYMVRDVTRTFPSWALYKKGNLTGSTEYFKYVIKHGKHTHDVYIFLDREDIEIRGPLKESLAETISKCTVSGGRKKRKRTNKRKSKRKRRN